VYRFLAWLASTPWSVALHESHYMFLLILTVHVLTLAVFAGTVVMMDLRLLGVTLGRVPVSEVIARLMPWSAAGFVVMFASGVLLFFAAPVLRYENLFFRVKMAALVLAVVNGWVFHHTTHRRSPAWDRDPSPPRHVKAVGVMSLALWALVITAGRFIPYQAYWFD
jgi:hypothetical protein